MIKAEVERKIPEMFKSPFIEENCWKSRYNHTYPGEQS